MNETASSYSAVSYRSRRREILKRDANENSHIVVKNFSLFIRDRDRSLSFCLLYGGRPYKTVSHNGDLVRGNLFVVRYFLLAVLVLKKFKCLTYNVSSFFVVSATRFFLQKFKYCPYPEDITWSDLKKIYQNIFFYSVTLITAIIKMIIKPLSIFHFIQKYVPYVYRSIYPQSLNYIATS